MLIFDANLQKIGKTLSKFRDFPYFCNERMRNFAA